MDTTSRNQRLHQYGFECDCEACKSKSSDGQRVRAGEQLKELELAASQGVSDADLVQRAESLARYVESKGFADYDVKTNRLVYKLAMLAGDTSRARAWAKKYSESQRRIDPTSIDTQRAEQLVEDVGL